MARQSHADGVTGSAFLRGQILRELGTAIGPNNVSVGEDELQASAADWSWMSKFMSHQGLKQPAPDFVVRPGSTQDVSKVVRIAADYKVPLIPRGGGSGTQGGT
ncbi:MAG: FAD-binding oxidoreductase, partial [Microbacteriaceae bacterium]|nr:FAD-binding oxidoreductase [Microbacteriaceae bacterium]